MFSEASPTRGCHKSPSFPCPCCLCLKNTQCLPSCFPDLIHIQYPDPFGSQHESCHTHKFFTANVQCQA